MAIAALTSIPNQNLSCLMSYDEMTHNVHDKEATYEMGRGNLWRLGLQSYNLRSVAIGN